MPVKCSCPHISLLALVLADRKHMPEKHKRRGRAREQMGSAPAGETGIPPSEPWFDTHWPGFGVYLSSSFSVGLNSAASFWCIRRIYAQGPSHIETSVRKSRQAG